MSIRIVKVNGLKGEQRKGVCYVGRAFAGWPESPWCNPYRVGGYGNWTRERCLEAFRKHCIAMPDDFLPSLWEACEHGTKPLGCWCTTAVVGDGSEVICHGQILASMLYERYVKPAMEIANGLTEFSEALETGDTDGFRATRIKGA